MERIVIETTVETKHQLKMTAVKRNISMKELIQEAIENLLNKKDE